MSRATTHSRSSLREQIMRTARRMPDATNDEIAKAVGCHRDTVRRHLPDRRPDGGPAAARHAGLVAGPTASTYERERAQRAAAERYEQLVAEGSNRAAEAVAGAPDTSPELLALLAGYPWASVMASALANPNLPSGLLDRLITMQSDPDNPSHSTQRRMVMRNPALREDLIRELATTPTGRYHGDPPDTWSLLAENPACPADVLSAFVSDRRTPSAVLQLAAAHPNTSPEALSQLAGAFEPDARVGVAANPNTLPETLILLSEDPHPDVRRGVLARDDCPPQALINLAGFGNADPEEVRLTLASRHDCPPEALAILAKDPQSRVLFHVLRRRDCPPEAVRTMTEAARPDHRAAALQHPNCPKEVVRSLAADDPDVRVRMTAESMLAFRGRFSAAGRRRHTSEPTD